VHGTPEILEALRELLKVGVGEVTTDGEFIVETVSCLGVCASGPVIQVDDAYHKVRVNGLDSLLADVRVGKADTTSASVMLPPPVEQSFVAKAVAGSRVRNADISVTVCGGTGCSAAGCDRVAAAMEQGLKDLDIYEHVTLKRSGCSGLCERGPIVGVKSQGDTLYQNVAEADVSEIVGRSVIGNEVIERLVEHDPVSGRFIGQLSAIPFYAGQTRAILSPNGSLSSCRIEDYIESGGYKGLNAALAMEPGELVEVMAEAALRERSGSGVPVADRWRALAEDGRKMKCVACQACGVETGLYIARALLEGNPHSVLEGMIIGGYATSASEGLVYMRDERSRAAKTVIDAIEQARDKGHLGRNIMDSGFDFDIYVVNGAELCAPGSTLDWHSAETWANVSLVMANGATRYAGVGTKSARGTKIFSLTGESVHLGLVEVPMGTTLRQIVQDIGGGVRDGRRLKGIHIGGNAGGCLPASMLDIKMDFEELAKAGATMGSSEIMVMDDSYCMVAVSKHMLFSQIEETCGKCVPCRDGIYHLYEILERITSGRGSTEDIELLKDAAGVVTTNCRCSVGSAAANPVLSALRYFTDEYAAHIQGGTCFAGVCKRLTADTID
jgi:NADH-quinone oxidoreductase subunit F